MPFDKAPIIIDLDGSDHGWEELLEGIMTAARNTDRIGRRHFTLVSSDWERVQAHIRANAPELAPFLHAESAGPVFPSSTDSTDVLKDEYGSCSIRTCLCRLRNVEDAGFLSFSNSGALMVAALNPDTGVGSIPGIRRPALAAILPSLMGPFVLLDVGANTDCKAEHLVQFAYMGKVLAEQVLHYDKPRIRLISVGEEPSKGSLPIRRAHHQLKAQLGEEFGGNAEGNLIYRLPAAALAELTAHPSPVVVCDGLVGNVILKTSEGLALYFFDLIRSTPKRLWQQALFLGLKGFFRKIMKTVDWRENNGAILVGLTKVVARGHGRSNRRAAETAVYFTCDCVDGNVPARVASSLPSLLENEPSAVETP